MKSFFEEYGFVILAAIVVILLIAMATPIGDLVKAQITGIVDSFANKTESKLNAVDAGAITVRASKNVKGVVELDWDAEKTTDVFGYAVRVTDSTDSANWTTKYSDETPETEADGGNFKSKLVGRKLTVSGLKNNAKVEYKIYDSNKVVVASGTVVARN